MIALRMQVRISIDTPAFGLVQFVVVGATMVGSINLSVAVGDQVAKGDELGFFAFGGSTCIALLKADKIRLDSDIVRLSSRCDPNGTSIDCFHLVSW
jgi:phosphatidylserine decarboxylase